jgi:predicted GNAT family acetyltransferase
MEPVVQKVTVWDEMIELSAGIRRPEVDAVARTGGFETLNRLSSTLAHVCAVLSEHLRTAANDDERRILDRLTMVAGDLFVAVRLSRFEAQGRISRTATDPDLRCRGESASEALEATAMAQVHSVQWTILDSCHDFLTEWEDVEVSTLDAAGRLRHDATNLVTRIAASFLKADSRRGRPA